MFNKFLVGNEKACIGGVSAAAISLLGQLGVNGQLTLKEAVYAVVTWVFTHLVVWVTTNTPKAPILPPTIVEPITELHPPLIPTI